MREHIGAEVHDGTQDAAGQPDYSTGWSATLAAVPCSIEVMGGAEAGRGSTDFKVTFVFYAALSALDNTWRLNDATKHGVMNVVSVRRFYGKGGRELVEVMAKQ